MTPLTFKVYAPLVVLDSKTILKSAAIIVHGGAVAEVGPAESLKAVKTDKTIRLKDLAVHPGFVNVHCHLELSSMRNMIRRRSPFTRWIEELVALRAAAAPGVVASGVRRGIRRLLETGATTVGDVTSGFRVNDHLIKSGLRAVVFHETLAYDPSLAESRLSELSRRLESAPQTDLVRNGVSPHAVYSVSAPLFEGVARMARQGGMPLCVHLCETEDELLFSKYGEGQFKTLLKRRGLFASGSFPGKGPVESVAETGALNGALLIHMNHPSRGDLSAIKAAGASVAFCPNSNHWFKRRVEHPLPALLRKGVPVGVGTDSLASNIDLDMRAEARRIMKLFPDLPPGVVFDLLTSSGARALGMPQGYGTLNVGAPFDAAASRAKLTGGRDTLVSIIKARTPVSRLWVAGVERYRGD